MLKSDNWIGSQHDVYRPLTIASYALNFAVAGLSSSAFHVVNIALHAAVCALVVALIDALFCDYALATVTGVLFATHPVHTEAVAGIVGRAEILAALFLLTSIYLHARRYAVRGLGPAFWLPIALLSYFCALLSKETAIAGAVLLPIVEFVQQPADCEASKRHNAPCPPPLQVLCPRLHAQNLGPYFYYSAGNGPMNFPKEWGSDPTPITRTMLLSDVRSLAIWLTPAFAMYT